jgi:glutathione S-transferase
VSVPWWFVGLAKPPENPLEGWLTARLDRLNAVLETRDHLAAGRFTLADLLMTDILRVPKLRALLGPFPALEAYIARITARPAFAKALQDQLDLFAAADAARAKG